MSNSTSTATGVTPTSTQAPSPTSTSSNIPPTSSTANTSPTVAPSTESTSSFSTSSFSPPTTSSQSTTSEPPSTTSTPTSTTSTSTSTTSSAPTTTSQSESVRTSVITQTPTNGGDQSRSTIVITSTAPPATTADNTSSSTSSSAGSTGTAGLVGDGAKSSSGGLNGGGKIAVAVVVPIVAVALIVLAGLFLWRKRMQRKDAEELRRKEVEEYGYNPNNDPTLPAVGSASGDGPFEMREDGSSGYRGWGTTAVASSGRKASTTLSGPSAGGIGMAYSEGTSPTHGPVSDTRSDNPLMDGRPLSTEAEALGAMGPAVSGNRSGDINRGPSNASSSYSAANRSDGSGEAGLGGGQYNNQYDTGNPYGGEAAYGSPPGRAEMSGQPVIRDVQARRNTRIENPSHFPQQSAGIAQNF